MTTMQKIQAAAYLKAKAQNKATVCEWITYSAIRERWFADLLCFIGTYNASSTQGA